MDNQPFPMKMIISLLLLALGLIAQVSNVSSDEASTTNEKEQRLVISVREVRSGSVVYFDDSLVITWSNRGLTPIYLLDLFEVEGMPYSLELSLRDSCGQQVFHYVPHVKVELAGPLRYVALEPGETLSLPLNLSAVAHAVLSGKLPGGKYTLTVTYFNRLGQRCFQGSIASEPVELTVTE